MDYVIAVLFFVLGLSLGSFLCVCIDRLPRGGSVIRPPSHCDSCGRKLGTMDLIPIVSYLVLRGKCRYCGVKIPVNVLIVELITGLLFLLFWLYYGLTLDLLFALIYGCFFIVIFFIDLKHYLVLNKVIYPAIVIALIIAAATQYNDIKVPLLGGLIAAGILLLIALVSRGGMGIGDVKLGAFIGLIVGYYQGVSVFLLTSFILGGIIATALFLSKRKGGKESIPFAPFLIVGGVVAMLYGDVIWKFWIGL
ncbi:prepilin peptidase [Chloroflexota bacterium]